LSDRLSRRIYLLDPRQYSPETIAVAFAKTSRSPLSFDEIATELNEEKSTEFNEKWVVGYGHSSVAEHAVLHIAIENVSRLAVECVESNRLASFTEKSSRYQKWDPRAFFTPPELEDHALNSEYQKTCTALFSLYLECQPQLRAQLARECPLQPAESNGAFERRLNSAALDVARYLLPAASLANLGMTANARTLEHAISKMLTSPLEEVHQIGLVVKETACASVPTLIKYAAANEHLRSLTNHLTPESSKPITNPPPADWLKLVNFNSFGVEKVLASILFRYGSEGYEQYFEQVTHMDSKDKKSLLGSILDGIGEHDSLPHEFEHTSYTFDGIMDQGAYYEFKRHRMMTQSPQELSAELGYATPRLFKESGLLDLYQQLMDTAATTWARLAAWNPAVAGYVVPNGFNRRVLFSLNIREAYTLIKLRSSPNAHFAVRQLACRMAEEIQKAHPLLEELFSSSIGESWQDIQECFFLKG
jgi:thymidylate synthase ThyX